MASTAPGPLVTSDHQGPRVDIAVWVCLVTSGLAVVSKVLTKIGRSQKHVRFSNLELDDLILGIAYIFAIGQSIAVSRQVHAGLGDHYSSLSTDQIRAYEQAGFSSQLLYICSLAAAKLAACLFTLHLQPHSRSKSFIQGLMSSIGLWALISIFSIAFQCQIPNTWAITSDQCFNRPAFWTFVEIVNMMSDLALVALLFSIVWILQTKSKAMLLTVFAARGLILAPIIFRLVHIYEADTSHSDPSWDPTFQETDVAIATAILMNASIVLTCVPFLKPLMEAMQPGWSTSDVVQGVGFGVAYGKNSLPSGHYPQGSVISGESVKTIGSKGKRQSGGQSDQFDLESRDEEMRESQAQRSMA